MDITLKIRFSIPSTLMMDDFKRQLTQSGFFVEKITPALPCGQEIMAYVMTGVFHGEWQDLFTAWRRASTEAAIQEAILNETKDEK